MKNSSDLQNKISALIKLPIKFFLPEEIWVKIIYLIVDYDSFYRKIRRLYIDSLSEELAREFWFYNTECCFEGMVTYVNDDLYKEARFYSCFDGYSTDGTSDSFSEKVKQIGIEEKLIKERVLAKIYEQDDEQDDDINIVIERLHCLIYNDFVPGKSRWSKPEDIGKSIVNIFKQKIKQEPFSINELSLISFFSSFKNELIYFDFFENYHIPENCYIRFFWKEMFPWN